MGDEAMRRDGTGSATWAFIVSEAIDDGGAVERHRVPVADGDEEAARREAEAWARGYGVRTGSPTTVELATLDAEGHVREMQAAAFYFDPAYPERDPHNPNGY